MKSKLMNEHKKEHTTDRRVDDHPRFTWGCLKEQKPVINNKMNKMNCRTKGPRAVPVPRASGKQA